MQHENKNNKEEEILNKLCELAIGSIDCEGKIDDKDFKEVLQSEFDIVGNEQGCLFCLKKQDVAN